MAKGHADGRFRATLPGDRTHMGELLCKGATLTCVKTGRTCIDILALEAAPILGFVK
jgi:hypothetical protein